MTKLNLVVPPFLWRMVLMLALCVMAGCVSTPKRVPHSFGFDTRKDDQNTVILNYRYGSSMGVHVYLQDDVVEKGQSVVMDSVYQTMYPGEYLYVKWRDLDTSAVHERTVDLRDRLPKKIERKKVYFMTKGAKLSVYLVSESVRPPQELPNGPSVYHHYHVETIYAD